MHSPVVLTGGTGYLGSQILMYLLENNYEVRLTARDKSKTTNELSHLLSNYPELLSVCEADLMQEGSFDEVMQGAKGVIHCASPFKISGIKNPRKELIEPAVKGTINVLNAANDSKTVLKVVLTSSIAAVYGDAVDKQLIEKDSFDESHWNKTSSISHQPYSYSKTLAEEEAWKLAEKANFQLITINPGFILGPTPTKRSDSESIALMLDVLSGKFSSGIPPLYFGFVDVRDCARAHLLALENKSSVGRHICVGENSNMLEVAKILKKEFGNRYKISTKKLPKILIYIFGPIFNGLSWNYLKKNLNIPLKFNNQKIKESFDMSFRPLSETVIDHAKQLITDELVK